MKETRSNEPTNLPPVRIEHFTSIFLLSTVLLSSFFNTEINAQTDSSQQILFNQIYLAAELEYGIDQELVNGVLFENIYLYAIGHPYFLADSFNNGRVVYHRKLYPDLLLKYDLYDQQVIVNYTSSDMQVIFILPKKFISEFNIGNKKFVKRSVPGKEDDRIYQSIGEVYPVEILYTWEKIRTNSYHNFLPSYEFGEDKKSSFLLINSNLLAYNRNGSFVSKFPEKNQKLIKKYIRENRIRVKHSTDSEMESLIRYCNSLDNSALVKPD